MEAHVSAVKSKGPYTEEIPRLPRANEFDSVWDVPGHRNKLAQVIDAIVAIARKVSKSEWARTPEAKAAMDKEWNRLRFMKRPDPADAGIGVWDEKGVKEYSDVVKHCRLKGIEATFARIAELCTEKNSELPKGHKSRKFKGRAVYLGHNVRTHRFEWAVFQELGSNPPSMEAAKFLDAISCANGY